MQSSPFWRTIRLDPGKFLFAYRDLEESRVGWARGEIMNTVNEIRVIHKTFEALLFASTVLSSKMESNTESCPQGAHRQVGKTFHVKLELTACQGRPEPSPEGGVFDRGRCGERAFQLADILHIQGWLGPVSDQRKEEEEAEGRGGASVPPLPC